MATQSKNISDRLEKVERTIAVYKTGADEPFIEINVDIIPFETIKHIVIAKDDDPLMYDGYRLGVKEIEQFNNYLQEKIEVNFEKYFYILICTGIYDWE